MDRKEKREKLEEELHKKVMNGGDITDEDIAKYKELDPEHFSDEKAKFEAAVAVMTDAHQAVVEVFDKRVAMQSSIAFINLLFTEAELLDKISPPEGVSRRDTIARALEVTLRHNGYDVAVIGQD